MAVGDTFFMQIGPVKHECRIGDESGTIIALPSMTTYRSLYAWLKSCNPAQTQTLGSCPRTANSSNIIHERSGRKILSIQRDLLMRDVGRPQRRLDVEARADVAALTHLCNDFTERQPRLASGDDGAFPRMLFEFLRRIRGDADSAIDDLEKIWNSAGDGRTIAHLDELAGHAACSFDSLLLM
jgi:hypothetical protein